VSEIPKLQPRRRACALNYVGLQATGLQAKVEEQDLQLFNSRLELETRDKERQHLEGQAQQQAGREQVGSGPTETQTVRVDVWMWMCVTM
jgi:hypothetical protein